MFLRATKRQKDGKEHRYWSVVENVRPAAGPAHQKTLLYLGDLNDSQHAAWTKALTVFNADSGQSETRSLFPSDRTPPLTAAPALSLCLGDYALSRPRQYGACWLACDLWRQLGLDQFWADKLPPSREGTDWAKLLQVSVANRLIAPGSEWRCHRQWYDQSAMGDLLGDDFHWGGKDQLYSVLDRLVNDRLVAIGAQRAGVRVGDKELARRIAEEPFFQVEGRFSKDRYEQVAKSQGLTPVGLDERLREDFRQQQFRRSIVDTAFVPRATLDSFIRLSEQMREVSVVNLTPEAGCRRCRSRPSR